MMERNEVLKKSQDLVNQIYENMGIIESCDTVAEKIRGLDICFNDPDSKQHVTLNGVLREEQLEDIRDEIIATIYKNSMEAQKFLERLDRKPAVINPEFEAAFQEMIGPVKKDPEPEVVIPDKLEIKHSTTIDKQVKQVKVVPIPAEKSLEKFPAKRKSPYPEHMTEAAVRELYINQGKTITQVASHFGVEYSKANSFITGHKLHRNQQESAKQPAEKERP